MKKISRSTTIAVAVPILTGPTAIQKLLELAPSVTKQEIETQIESARAGYNPTKGNWLQYEDKPIMLLHSMTYNISSQPIDRKHISDNNYHSFIQGLGDDELSFSGLISNRMRKKIVALYESAESKEFKVLIEPRDTTIRLNGLITEVSAHWIYALSEPPKEDSLTTEIHLTLNLVGQMTIGLNDD